MSSLYSESEMFTGDMSERQSFTSIRAGTGVEILYPATRVPITHGYQLP